MYQKILDPYSVVQDLFNISSNHVTLRLYAVFKKGALENRLQFAEINQEQVGLRKK